MIKLNLRLPEPLHATLTRLAQAHNRSLNSEIITALELYAALAANEQPSKKPKRP